MQPPQTTPQAGTSPFTPEIIRLVVGVLTTVVGALILDRIRARNVIRVRQIRRSIDRDVEGFVQLYDKLIPDATRLDSSEIIRWIDEDRVLRKLESHNYHHFLLVGKLSGKVVSFLKVMYCSDTKYMFVAYYGIDTSLEPARRLAAPAMMRSLVKLVRREARDCKAVLCEVEAPDERLDSRENSLRKARIRLFKETARRMNFRLYEIGIDYLSPQMDVSPDGKFEEQMMTLLYAPVGDSTPLERKMSREKVLEILRVIFLQIYRPTHRHDPAKDLAYQTYLDSLISLYESELPDTIDLID